MTGSMTNLPPVTQPLVVVLVFLAPVAMLLVPEGKFDVFVSGVLAALTALAIASYVGDNTPPEIKDVQRISDGYERKGKYFRLKMRWWNGKKYQPVYAERYPLATLAADLVLVVIPKGRPAHEGEVLLIKRANQGVGSSNVGKWAIPGGCVPDDPNVTALKQALTELHEETGIALERGTHVRLVDFYDDPNRDTRKRFVSVAYLVVLHEKPELPEEIPCGHEVDGRKWFNLGELAKQLFAERHEKEKFTAFDHHCTLVDAMSLLEYNHELFSMLGGADGVEAIRTGHKK